jgi:hypothetical protein
MMDSPAVPHFRGRQRRARCGARLGYDRRGLLLLGVAATGGVHAKTGLCTEVMPSIPALPVKRFSLLYRSYGVQRCATERQHEFRDNREATQHTSQHVR